MVRLGLCACSKTHTALANAWRLTCKGAVLASLPADATQPGLAANMTGSCLHTHLRWSPHLQVLTLRELCGHRWDPPGELGESGAWKVVRELANALTRYCKRPECVVGRHGACMRTVEDQKA